VSTVNSQLSTHKLDSPTATMSRSSFVTILIACIVLSSSAFAPNAMAKSISTKNTLKMGFGMGDGEKPKKLTRDNEPEEYFSSNLDKMSDSEKLPLAIGGLLVISLPFIAGLIALYSAK
jgi:hypothetical protein